MENKSNPSKNITEEERLRLAEKLDKDLEQYINSLPKRENAEPVPLEQLTEELQNHPFFMKELPKEGDELHPLYEGLQQLKYDPAENTCEELALSYKEDGNFNFKHRKYRLAVLTYTEGIRTGCQDAELLAVLYNNRAAANFCLENYRSALDDCEKALELRPGYEKPLVRAAQCCLHTGKHDRCMQLCDAVLAQRPGHAEVLTLRQRAASQAERESRDTRRRQASRRQQQEVVNKLLDAIAASGVVLDKVKPDRLDQADGDPMRQLEPPFPGLAGACVAIGPDGGLVWPVALMYPEYRTVDFIRSFPDSDRLADQLEQVLAERPAWDTAAAYTATSVTVYLEDKRRRRLLPVNCELPLRRILQEARVPVTSGTPCFLVFARGCAAERHFLHAHSS